jgi:zinc protease
VPLPKLAACRVAAALPALGVSTLELEKLLRAEVDRIAKEGVSETELNRVKTQLVASQIYKRDSLFGQAMEIGMMEMTGIGHRQIDRLIERLKAVTADQVKSVAQRYFSDDALTIATLVPLPIAETQAPAPSGLRH